jgi:glyoxylase-like metal-dependent hydrolase (beta-lactamase superfamily II)
MKARRTIRVFLLLAASSTGAAEPGRGFASTPISGSVSVLQGYECNIAVSAGVDGIVMVDTCVEKVAPQLLAAVQKLSSQPLRFVINTHEHGDHTYGNAFFQKLAPVVAHHSVRTRLATGNQVTREKPLAPEFLPIVTFDSEMILNLNGEEIRLLHLPPGHTDGDVVVFFKKANVVCMGDVFMSPGVSFGDRHNGGGMLRLIAALEFVLPQIPDDAKIIPGHGTISTRSDIVRGLDVLKQMKAVVDTGVREHKTLEQLTAERPFDQFRNSVPAWASSDKSMDGWLRDFYREIAPK